MNDNVCREWKKNTEIEKQQVDLVILDSATFAVTNVFLKILGFFIY